MKVIKFLFFSLLTIVLIRDYGTFAMKKDDLVSLDYKALSRQVIRFHFIANSDSDYDQYIKNSLKDEILEYIYRFDLKKDKLDNIKILREHIEDIECISREFLLKHDVNQSVRVDIGKKYFDERIYGSYVIPEGIYDYFIVYIGEGKGKNFWSLLFSNIGFLKSDDSRIDSILSLVKSNEDNKSLQVSKLSKKEDKGIKISFSLFGAIKEFCKKIF